MGNVLIQALMVKEGLLGHDPVAVISTREQLLELGW
jgi:hypothetical protein